MAADAPKGEPRTPRVLLHFERGPLPTDEAAPGDFWIYSPVLGQPAASVHLCVGTSPQWAECDPAPPVEQLCEAAQRFVLLRIAEHIGASGAAE